MADEKASSKVSGWVKSIATSLFGIVSGAAIMYLTPLVNNVVKPAKPVPNFAQQASSLTVTFNNRSTGGSQGWWDFGDGSALEPFEPAKDAITHTYAKPGNYNVKLSLQNILGEESERTVAITLDNSQSVKPSIDLFSVVALSKNAPATFKLYSDVKNAKLIAWGLSDEPLKMETQNTPEKLLMVNDVGNFTVRLVAFNGTEVVEKIVPITVDDYSTKPTAILKVMYEGVRVEKKTEDHNLVMGWDPKVQGATCPVNSSMTLPQGWTITDAKYDPPATDAMRNLKMEVSQDRTQIKVAGEMLKPKTMLTGKKVSAPQCGVRVHVTMVRRGKTDSKAVDPVSFELTAPGSTMLPLPSPPAGFETQNKRIALEIRDGAQLLWNNPVLPNAAQVAMKGKVMSVTALEQSGQLRVDVLESRGVTPVSRPNPR